MWNSELDVSLTGIRCFGRQVEDVCRIRRPGGNCSQAKSQGAKQTQRTITTEFVQVEAAGLEVRSQQKETNGIFFFQSAAVIWRAYCSNGELSEHGGKNTSVTTGQELPSAAETAVCPRLPGTPPTRLKLMAKQNMVPKESACYRITMK